MAHIHHHAHRAGPAAPSEFAAVGLAPLGAAAGTPAAVGSPTKDEAPRLAGTAGFRDQGKADNPDSEATPTAEQQAADAKRFATLRARLALAGWALSGTPAGTFHATRWGMVRELASLDAVVEFTDRVGAAR